MSHESPIANVVLDTNILVSSVFWMGNPHTIVELAIDRKIKAYTSTEILAELEEVLKRDFLEDHDFIDSQIALILEYAEVVMPAARIKAVKDDPEDDKIIECAVAAGADYIITGDPHLLNLKEFQGTKIVKPTDFLTLISHSL